MPVSRVAAQQPGTRGPTDGGRGGQGARRGDGSCPAPSPPLEGQCSLRGSGTPWGRGPRRGSGDTIHGARGGDMAGKREARDDNAESPAQPRPPPGAMEKGVRGWQGAVSGAPSFGKPGLSRPWPSCCGEGRLSVLLCAPAPQQGLHGCEGWTLKHTHVRRTAVGPCLALPKGLWGPGQSLSQGLSPWLTLLSSSRRPNITPSDSLPNHPLCRGAPTSQPGICTHMHTCPGSGVRAPAHSTHAHAHS